MESYYKKLSEAQYNLNLVEELFTKRDKNMEHALNNFLSSAQSVFWVLNKEFDKNVGYKEWSDKRGERLPKDARIFKELRNISLKQYPVEHTGVVLGFQVENLPAHATVSTPWIDTRIGKPVSNKCIIKTKEGEEYEVDGLAVHDFIVHITSDKKEYTIEKFITQAREYLVAIAKEVEFTIKIFKSV